tara:strand:+ start:113 stop:472 length:360 start_codon:yes stop_codon:yes gene_type:complete
MKIIAFDLDDVLCRRDIEGQSIEKYKSCKPIKEMIKITNNCYDEGYHIIIYTARGMNVFAGDVNAIYSNLYELTMNQLKEWNVKFHQLIMGKIHYDLLIDDKAVCSDKIKTINDVLECL